MKQNTSPKEQKISKQKPIIIDEINNHDGNEIPHVHTSHAVLSRLYKKQKNKKK